MTRVLNTLWQFLHTARIKFIVVSGGFVCFLATTAIISNLGKKRKSQSKAKTSQFLLPQHLCEQFLVLVEKVRHFAVLVVTFGRHKDAVHRLRREVFADLRNGKNNLFHGAVAAYDLDLSGVLRVVVERRVGVQLAVHVVWLRWTQLVRQLLVVTCKLSTTSIRHFSEYALYKFTDIHFAISCLT